MKRLLLILLLAGCKSQPAIQQIPRQEQAGISKPVPFEKPVMVLSAGQFRYPFFSFDHPPDWDLVASSNMVTWFVYPTNAYKVVGADIYITNDSPQMFFKIHIHK